MVATRDGEAVAVHRARNAAASALRYAMDPMEQYQLQNGIDEAGLDLGMIYHSHTRSDPIPSETDINLASSATPTARLPRHALPDRRRQGPRGGPAPVVDRGQHGRAGRLPGDGMTGPLVCPSCDRAHAAHERFCEDCGLPLVQRERARARPSSPCAPARSARATPRARWCAPPGRATRPRPSSSRACCWKRAFRRWRAAPAASTCPTSWPRARATSWSPPPGGRRARLLGDRSQGVAPPATAVDARAGVASRALAVTCSSRRSIAGVAGRRRASRLTARASPRTTVRGVSATRSRCGAPSAGRRSRARGRARRDAARGQRDARAVALLARQQVEDRAAQQQRVGARGRERGRRPFAQPARDRGRTWRVCPESHCAAPSTSHAQRAQRATRGGESGGGSFGWPSAT